MCFDLKDCRAVVTGGAGGIGREIARDLHSFGCHVAVVDIDAVGADHAVEALIDVNGASGEQMAFGVEADVTDGDAVNAACDHISSRLGGIEILVNCAGFPEDAKLTAMSDDAWRRVIDASLYGSFAWSRAVAPLMIERAYGRIINISSRAYLGNPGQANYSAAKAGVIGLTRSLAKELGRYDITANAIAPGLIRTAAVEKHPKFELIESLAIENSSVKRVGTPQDVAFLACFLASRQAGYITGEVIHLTGGRFG